MTVIIDPDKSSLLRAAPRLMQIVRVLARHKILGALRGKRHWPPPSEVRETFEDLGRTFLKFGQVLSRIKEKTGKLGRELERLLNDAPGDTRRILRRFAEGNLGRLQSPGIEALGGRISRNLERLTGAIAAAALVIGGAMLLIARLDDWIQLLGEGMVVSGVLGTFTILIVTLRHDHGRR